MHSNTVGEGSPLPFRNECYFNFKRNSLRHFLAKMPPPSAEGGSVRSASFYSRILCKRLHANIILHTNTVGARIARPFRNECNFCFVTGRRGRRPLQQYAIKTVTIRLHANNILLLNTVGEHSICSRNTKRADMESAPTANNVILMHTVGGDGLTAARSRSGKNNTPCCFLRPSRRFATLCPQNFFWRASQLDSAQIVSTS